jgi:hypothetical protein
MSILVFVLLAVAVLILAIEAGKPYGLAAAALTVLAILSQLAGWPR